MSSNGTETINHSASASDPSGPKVAVGPVPSAPEYVSLAAPPYVEPELTYYKQGFFCAVDGSTVAGQDLTAKIDALSKQLDAAVAAEETVSRAKWMELGVEIERTAADIKTLETATNTSNGEPESASAGSPPVGERQRVDRDIGELRQRLYEKKRELVAARTTRAPEAVRENLALLTQEADAVLDHALQLSRKRHEIAVQDFESSRDTLKERAARLEQAEAVLAEAADPLVRLQRRLHRAGLTREVANVLAWTGTAGLFVCGWFFSVFTASSNLNNADYISFFAGRVVSALDASFKVPPGERGVLLGAYIAAWLVLLATVWVVSWVTERVLAARQELTGIPEEVLQLLGVGRRPLFPAWLRVTPLIYVAGVIVLLLAFFGPQQNDLDTLLKSLSGQPVGVALALMVSGAALLYIATVVEPRFRDGDDLSSGLKDHLEAVVALASPFVIGFVTIVCVALAIPGNIALLWFLCALLLTATIFGYGIWAHGIHVAIERNAFRRRELGREREACFRPQEFDKSLIDNPRFRVAWLQRHQRLLANLDAWGEIAGAGTMRRWRWRGWLAAAQRDEFDRAHLPDLHQSVNDLVRDLGRLEDERAELFRRTRTGDADDVVTPAKLREKLVGMQRERNEVLTESARRVDTLRLEYLRRENALRDGFNLGAWYTRVDHDHLN